MSKIKEIRVNIPVELYEKFKLYEMKEYKKPTELVKNSIVNYVLDKEKEEFHNE